jgi:hypothetical protein
VLGVPSFANAVRKMNKKGTPLFKIIFLLSIVAFSSCRNAEDQLKQDATVQGTEAANASQRVENARATETEQSLATRQNLYHAMTGIYSGTLQITDTISATYTLDLVPTVWPYCGTRTRNSDEISSDLRNLSFQVELRADMTGDIHFSCVFSSVLPNELTGGLYLAKESCPYSAQVWLGDTVTRWIPKNRDVLSSQLAGQLLDGKMDSIPALYFEGISTRNGKPYPAVLMKNTTRK